MHTFPRVLLRCFVPVLLSAACGCIRVEQTLVLRADGSGTLEVRYGMSKESLADLEAAARDAVVAEGGDPSEAVSSFSMDEDEIRREVAAFEPDGVTLDFAKTEESEGWKYAHVKLVFTSLEGLAKTEFMSEKGMVLTRLEGGRYELRQVAASQGGPDVSGDEMKEMIAEMMKGFRAVLRIEVPGDIVESNADEAAGRVVTWIFDLEKDPGALIRAQTLEPRVVFSAEDASLPDFRPAAGDS